MAAHARRSSPRLRKLPGAVETLLALTVLLVTSLAPLPAKADVGVQAGPHGGVALSGDAHPYVGAGLRLTAPSSPLTLQPRFDYVFDEKQTLYHISGNILYEVPLTFRLKPYFGLGMVYSTFALDEPTAPSPLETNGGVDDNGHRLGLSLLAGARLDMPWVSPFVQLTKGVGEMDALTVGGGVELRLREQKGAPSAPEPMRFAITPYLANNVAGDVQSGRLGAGLSLSVHPWEHVGFELDGQLHGHFFRDEDVADLAPEGVDLDTKAAMLTGSVVARHCWGRPNYGAWCPYATAGGGVTRAWFDGRAHSADASPIAKAQTDPTLTTGLGITHLFTRHVGLRADARYFRALVDADARNGGYFQDYGFLRVSGGLSVGF